MEEDDDNDKNNNVILTMTLTTTPKNPVGALSTMMSVSDFMESLTYTTSRMAIKRTD